jgi:hypothetical protein
MMLEKFNPSKMQPNRPVLFAARPGCGKSTLMLDILYHNRDKYSHGIAMSATDDFTGFWSGPIPPSFVHNGYNAEATGKVIATQNALFQDAWDKLRAKNPQARKEDVEFDYAFIVDEDNAFGRDINTDMNVRQIMMNGRHLHIGYYLAVQYLMGLHSSLRGQIAYIFILHEVGKANRKRIHEAFFGVIESFEDFCDIMDWATEDHRCLVLDLTVKSNDYRKCVFWYKAQVRDPRSFRVGSPDFWGYHYARYTEEQEGALVEQQDAGLVPRTKRSGPVQVHLLPEGTTVEDLEKQEKGEVDEGSEEDDEVQIVPPRLLIKQEKPTHPQATTRPSRPPTRQRRSTITGKMNSVPF